MDDANVLAASGGLEIAHTAIDGKIEDVVVWTD